MRRIFVLLFLSLCPLPLFLSHLLHFGIRINFDCIKSPFFRKFNVIYFYEREQQQCVAHKLYMKKAKKEKETASGLSLSCSVWTKFHLPNSSTRRLHNTRILHSHTDSSLPKFSNQSSLCVSWKSIKTDTRIAPTNVLRTHTKIDQPKTKKKEINTNNCVLAFGSTSYNSTHVSNARSHHQRV